MDANVSTMTMPKTMPVQNLLRYISFKAHFCCCYFCCLHFKKMKVTSLDSAHIINNLVPSFTEKMAH